jgi:Fe-S cluster assembly ATP-binding protein
MQNTVLKVENLEASIDNKSIIKKFNLEVKENEIHVIMGPNGSGKSTFSKILAGHPSYNVENGNILFLNKNLLEMLPEERSHEGLFLAFQYPIEIGGVTNYDFLRLAYNEKQKYLKNSEVTPLEFMTLTQSVLKELKMNPEFLNRDLNQGFSGGEKKRNEILQMLLLNPDLVILDELDSGLDIDALKLIFQYISEYKDLKKSFIIITHTSKIFEYLKPDFIHVMLNGQIVKQGQIELVDLIEKKGYAFFKN